MGGRGKGCWTCRRRSYTDHVLACLTMTFERLLHLSQSESKCYSPSSAATACVHGLLVTHMASGSLQSVLSDRNEIHKSCKTLESVVNVLNDYCEAANAILTLEKKLAKALREAAGVKCVAEIPGAHASMWALIP